MHLIWKRPDGLYNSRPEDFRTITLSNGGHLWLNKQEIEWYPFQISGDWKGQDQTKKLNRLVNLLDAPNSAWEHFINHFFDDELKSPEAEVAPKEYFTTWLNDLENKASGNTWEVEIIKQAIEDVKTKIQST